MGDDGPQGSLRVFLSRFQRYEGEGAGEDHGGVRFVQTRLTRRQVLQIAPGLQRRRSVKGCLPGRLKVMIRRWNQLQSQAQYGWNGKGQEFKIIYENCARWSPAQHPLEYRRCVV